MKLLVNSQEIKVFQPNKSTTLGELLVVIQEQYVGPDEVLTGIVVDGENLTAELLRDWKDGTVEKFAQIDTLTEASNTYAAKGLRLIAENLYHSNPVRQQIVEHICKGQGQEAMELLSDFLATFNAANQVLASACRLMEIEPDSQEISLESVPETAPPKTVSQLIVQLFEQLEQVKTALADGDLVLLGDILDYEFPPLTDTWIDMLNQLAQQFDGQV